MLFLGSNLVRVSCVALDEIEKQTNLNYPLAISLLQCFLTLPRPYLSHRRGRWFNRICIDIENVCRMIADKKKQNSDQSSDSADIYDNYKVVYEESQSKVYDLGDAIVMMELQKYSFLIAHFAVQDSAVRVSCSNFYK